MTAGKVTFMDQFSSECSQRVLVARLTDLLASLERDRRPGGRTPWRVIEQAMRSEVNPKREPDRRIASLNSAAWHADLAGPRHRVPVGGCG